MIKIIIAAIASLSISSFGEIRSASNFVIDKWGSSTAGDYFIQVNSTEFDACNLHWIRVPTKEMWAQVLTITSNAIPINYMVVLINHEPHIAAYDVTTFCRLEWIGAAK